MDSSSPRLFAPADAQAVEAGAGREGGRAARPGAPQHGPRARPAMAAPRACVPSRECSVWRWAAGAEG